MNSEKRKVKNEKCNLGQNITVHHASDFRNIKYKFAPAGPGCGPPDEWRGEVYQATQGGGT